MTKDQISLNICISFFLTAQICILFRYFYLAALWVVLGRCVVVPSVLLTAFCHIYHSACLQLILYQYLIL